MNLEAIQHFAVTLGGFCSLPGLWLGLVAKASTGPGWASC